MSCSTAGLGLGFRGLGVLGHRRPSKLQTPETQTVRNGSYLRVGSQKVASTYIPKGPGAIIVGP